MQSCACSDLRDGRCEAGASGPVNAAMVGTTIHLSSVSVFGLHYVLKMSSTEEQPIAADVHSAAPAAVPEKARSVLVLGAEARRCSFMTMLFVIIPSRESESLGETICRPHPGKPSSFEVKRTGGNRDLWITDYTIAYQGLVAYAVSIVEFRDGKVIHETQYFGDPFEPPAWQRRWVQQNA